MKRQVFVIGGGDTFDTYQDYLKFLKSWRIDFIGYQNHKTDWKKHLPETLGKGYEVVYVDMPNKINCKYMEWEIWFRKFVPFMKPGAILIGHSQGGMFLAQYLSLNALPKKIGGVFMIAPPFDRETQKDSLADFALPKSLKMFSGQVEKIFIYQSHDDKIVPFRSISKYQEKLPTAKVRIFKDRGHFNQKKFPEIVKDIKSV